MNTKSIYELEDLKLNKITKEGYLEHNKDKCLSFACHKKNLDIIKYLLKNDADVHVRNDEPICISCKIGCVEITKLLIEYGADVRARNIPLYNACYHGHKEIVMLLLEHGAVVNAYSHLIIASDKGHTEIVRILLEYGADVHTDDEDSLIIACENGNLEVVKCLLEYGANVHARKGEAICKACSNGHIEVVKCLIKYGADVYVRNNEPLRNACLAGFVSLKVAKYLVENYYDCTRNNYDAISSLEWICTEEYYYINIYIKGLTKKSIFPKKPDDLVFKKTEGVLCPITQKVLTKDMRKLGCSKCMNVFSYDELTKWLNFGKGKKCPFRCDGSVFYEV